MAGGAGWILRQDAGGIHWTCGADRVRGEEPGEWLSRYLRLDDPLEKLEAEFGEEPVMRESLRALPGLRLIRQEPFECAVSFMFAQGLSVSVITQALEKFCGAFGRKIPAPREGLGSWVDFPEPADLAGLRPETLRPFVNNYRARGERVLKVAEAVTAGKLDLPGLRKAPFLDARRALLDLEGIGPKIADCILLFSLDHLSAFPLDRWVLRALARHYRPVRRWAGPKRGEAEREAPTRVQYAKLTTFALRRFGPRCGLASEYLFLFLRMREDRRLREKLESYTPGFDPAWIAGPPKRAPRRKGGR